MIKVFEVYLPDHVKIEVEAHDVTTRADAILFHRGHDEVAEFTRANILGYKQIGGFDDSQMRIGETKGTYILDSLDVLGHN